MQFGASLSGIQKGGCFPSTTPDSIEEVSDASGDGSRGSSVAIPSVSGRS